MIALPHSVTRSQLRSVQRAAVRDDRPMKQNEQTIENLDGGQLVAVAQAMDT